MVYKLLHKKDNKYYFENKLNNFHNNVKLHYIFHNEYKNLVFVNKVNF